jgi:ribosomal protein L40E
MASAQVHAPAVGQRKTSMVGEVEDAPSVQSSPNNVNVGGDSVLSIDGKVCVHCSRANPKEANYCNGCGRKLLSIPICPKCGNSNPEGSGFCKRCGFALA